jgi:hypothetical protein
VTARRSLRDRNREAIAQADTTPPGPVPPQHGGGERPAPTAAASPTRASRKAAPASRIGVYLTPEEFTDAKAAYLADWQHGGTADTFARWIAAAIDTHAARTAAERAEHARPRSRAATRTGSSRSFPVPEQSIAAMRAAIAADQRAGRWPTDSAWCGDAIAAAAERDRANAGGTLPPPPARLPNRLTR